MYKLVGWMTIKVSGSDRISYLNGIISRELDSKPEGRWFKSLLLNPQAKIRSIFWVMKNHDMVLIVVPPEFKKNLVEDLLKYNINVEIQLEDVSEEWEQLCFTTDRDNVDGIEGVHGDFVWSSISGQDYDRFIDLLEENNFPPFSALLGMQAVESGMGDSIDLEKGCFLGQEPISRMVNRGRPRNVIYCGTEVDVSYPVLGQGKSKTFFLVPYTDHKERKVTSKLSLVGKYPNISR